ncbi:uncharacterized protein MELLADRAFT_45702 [Melampsora larici-populina 98AG31]|uniref:Short-chain dehydrogenase/reductase 3 n=1 Tax=Melampsora larici-populina (strain 98AG31 / pathotype 3-4-7) TaxID=747676 RepID=F4S6X4_MELLP|nr:uncharacterized protein MELLADRAFT_45702 [Melampsora larici-populina 98AG31]EGF99603.1 hypothetical protein MELLADRAFT_45702 [Melampsora larici-populina 98AG31]
MGSYYRKSITIDILFTVANRTFLSPFFSLWIPIIASLQKTSSASDQFYQSSIYFLIIVSIRWLLNYSSLAWLNKTWRIGWGDRIDWDHQIVLVTGGSDGLGRVLVETLDLKNITLVVLDLKPFTTNPSESDVHYYQCDVSDPKAVEAVADRIKAEVGDPTIIINNAGVVNGKLIVDLNPNEVQRSFGVNVMSHFYLLKAFLPKMIELKQGHIVTVASVLGTIGVCQASDYCASKAACSSLHDSLRLELDHRHQCSGVRTTLVSPGRLETKMFGALRPQNRFLFPQVAPHDLAKLIIQTLDSNEGKEIWVPVYSKLTWVFKGFPSWAKDLAHWFAGSNEAMMDFHP